MKHAHSAQHGRLMARHGATFLGLALFGASLLFNPWLIGWFLTDDGSIDNVNILLFIWVFDLLGLGFGATLLYLRPEKETFKRIVLLLVVSVVCALPWVFTANSPSNLSELFGQVFGYYSIDDFVNNLLVLYLGILGCYLALGSGYVRARAKNLLAHLLSVGLIVVCIEGPALSGLVDYRNLLVPRGLSFSNAVLTEDLYFHRMPYEQFDLQLPGDTAVKLGKNEPKYGGRYAYDARGFRNDTDLDTAVVIALGDSFIEGYKVSQDETAAAVMAASLETDVANLGISGYGPVNQLAALKNVGLNLDPSIVVWFLYGGNDIYDPDSERTILDRNFSSKNRLLSTTILRVLANWTSGVVALDRTRLVPRGSFQTASGTESMFFEIPPLRSTPETAANLAKVQIVLREAKVLSDAAGAKFLLAYIPIKLRVYRGLLDDFDQTSRVWMQELDDADIAGRLAKWAAEEDMSFLDLTVVLRDGANSDELVYFLDDAHWTPAGNRLAGQAVAQYVRDRGWVKH